MGLDGTLWSLFVSPTAATSRGPKEFLWRSQPKTLGINMLVGEREKLHFDQREVLSFLAYVTKVFFLPSKRCLAVVLASLSWRRWTVCLCSSTKTQSKCSKPLSTRVVRETPCHKLCCPLQINHGYNMCDEDISTTVFVWCFIHGSCSCGSVVEHCVSSAKGHGFNSLETHILLLNNV